MPCWRSAGGPTGEPGKILRQYLVHCAAVKSYFAAHEVRLDTKVERSRHRPEGGGAGARMSLRTSTR